VTGIARRVSKDGTVTMLDTSAPDYIDPYTLPWVEGAEGSLPQATIDKYPDGPRDLREKQGVLKAKRPVAAQA
jgi:hypothetical protein